MQEGFIDVGAPLVAEGQAAEAIQPSQRTFHHPSVPAQALARLDAFTGDPAFDAARAQVPTAVTRIVGLARRGLFPAGVAGDPSGP